MADVTTFGDIRFRDIARCRQITSINNSASDADIGSAANAGANGAVTARYLTQLFLGTDSGSGTHALAQTRVGHDGTGTDENGYFSIHTNSGAEGTPNIAAGESLSERLSINAVGLVRVFGDLQVDGNLDVTGGIQFTDNQITIHTVSETTLRDVGFIAQRSKDATSGAVSGAATEAITGATVFAASTVTFPAGVVGDGTDDYYNGWFLKVGAEVVKVTDFVGATRVATIDPAWGLQPTNGAAVDAYNQSHVGTFYDESTDRMKIAYIADNSTDEFTYTGNVDVEAKNFDLEGTLNVDDTTDSTSTTTGAVVVDGGVGVAAAVFVGDGDNSSSVSTGEVVVTGGAGVSSNVYVGGNLRITDATESESSATGAFTVTGGMGVSANVYVVGNLVVDGDNTNLSTANLQIEDKLIEIGVPQSPTVPDDALTADGGGIALQGTTDKTIVYDYSATGAIFNTWDLSESMEIPLDRALYFGDAETDGSWRVRDNGSDFLRIEKRESGTYNPKWQLYAATVGGGGGGGGGGPTYSDTLTYTVTASGLPASGVNARQYAMNGFAKNTSDRMMFMNGASTSKMDVYFYNGSTWSLEDTLEPDVDSGDSVTLSLARKYNAMNEDGTVVVLFNTVGGHAYTYTQSGGVWTYGFKSTAIHRTNTAYKASLSPDGTYLATVNTSATDLQIWTYSPTAWVLEYSNSIANATFWPLGFNITNDQLVIYNWFTVECYTRSGSVWTLQAPPLSVAMEDVVMARDGSLIAGIHSTAVKVYPITAGVIGAVQATGPSGVSPGGITGTVLLEKIVVAGSGNLQVFDFDGVSTVTLDQAVTVPSVDGNSADISYSGDKIVISTTAPVVDKLMIT